MGRNIIEVRLLNKAVDVRYGLENAKVIAGRVNGIVEV